MKLTVALVAAVLFLLGTYLPSAQSLSSGVAISKKVTTVVDEIKLEKKHRYTILVIRNEREIDVETIGRRDATYVDFLRDLEVGGKAECRFGIFDLEHSKCKSLFAISWCPSTAVVRQKVIYASSYMELKKVLKGVQYLQATDKSEASEETILQSNMCTTKTVI